MRRGPGPALALLLLAGCAATAVRPPLEGATARLPAELGGFLRGGTTPVDAVHGQGSETAYATRNRAAIAVVRIYDRGRPTIPAVLPEAELSAELDRSVAEAIEAAPNRTGRRLAEVSRAPVPAPDGPPLTCATLHGAFGRSPVLSEVCVGTAAGRLVKVTVTMPGRGAPVADPQAFAAGIAAALRGEGGA